MVLVVSYVEYRVGGFADTAGVTVSQGNADPATRQARAVSEESQGRKGVEVIDTHRHTCVYQVALAD